MAAASPGKKLKCLECNRKFSRNFNLKRHIHLMHSDTVLNRCELCGTEFSSYDELSSHHKNIHTVGKSFVLRESAFRKNILKYRYIYPQRDENVKIEHFHNHFMKNKVLKTLKHVLVKKKSIKFEIILIAEMVQKSEDGDIFVRLQVPFRSFSVQASIHMLPELSKDIQMCFAKIADNIEDFQNCGSGYVYAGPIALDLEIAKYSGIRIGKNYPSFNLKALPNHKFLENVPGKKYCFLYCLIKFLHPEKTFSMDLNDYKPYMKMFNGLKGAKKIHFPISMKDIPKFMKQNSHLDVMLNVLHYQKSVKGIKNYGQDKTSWPIREILPVLCNVGTGSNILNLLVIPNQKHSHCVMIKDVNNFLRSYYRNGKKTVSYAKSKYCLRCFSPFRSEKRLKKHQDLCNNKGPRLEECPDINSSLIEFTKVRHLVKQELVGFADFEAIMTPQHDVCSTCSTIRCKCERQSFTRVENKQKSCCYSFVIINSKNEVIIERYYVGKNANIHFLQTLFGLENFLSSYFNNSAKMCLSREDEDNFNSADVCYLCKNPFTEKDIKVRGTFFYFFNE